MLKPTITAQDACDLLNELLKLDYYCIRRLIMHREECNDEVSNHPTVQVQDEDGSLGVGIIGIINGMFGVRDDGMGTICYEQDDDGRILQFKLTPEKK